MRRAKSILALSFLLLVLANASVVYAQKRLLILGWNVESGENDSATISQQLEALEGYDLIGLTEVNSANAVAYAEAAAKGEGAKGHARTDFRHRVSQSGRGDRTVIIWDNKRLELIGQAQELDHLNDDNHRAPFFAHFRLRGSSVAFLFMVNHLARIDADLRQRQATGLKEWAAQQNLPVIAVGDYNFDYDIDDGMGNQAMKKMLEGGIWQWVRPRRLHRTQASNKFYSVLDFIFLAHKPDHWQADSWILQIAAPIVDDNNRSDHRPVEARILISEP